MRNISNQMQKFKVKTLKALCLRLRDREEYENHPHVIVLALREEKTVRAKKYVRDVNVGKKGRVKFIILC